MIIRFRRKKKRYTDKYLSNLVIKAGNLARYWEIEAERTAATGNLPRMKRILNHIHRVAQVQQLALTRRDDYRR